MAEEIKAIDDLRERFPNERACRRFLERSIWKDGRFCHHCGSLTTWPIRGPSARDGLYECAHCHHQFSVTTRTPMHAKSLPLWRWLLACYFLFQSSKGVSSVFLARWVGVSQKTAWKMGHAIREMMRTPDNAPLLAGLVEMDEKFIGGKPRFQKDIINKRGKGTKKAGVFIAVQRQGQAGTAPIPNDGYDALSPLADAVVRKDAHLMTDGNPTYRWIGQDYRRHESVDHTSKEFVWGPVHSNTAESFGRPVGADEVRDLPPDQPAAPAPLARRGGLPMEPAAPRPGVRPAQEGPPSDGAGIRARHARDRPAERRSEGAA